MRTLLFILLFIPNFVIAQSIDFKKININAALEEAKKSQKDIFINIYTSFCESCNWMDDQVFNTKKVSQYYNQNYISISIDAESKEGKQLIEKYKLLVYPSFLYLNKRGNALHLIVGNMDENQFLRASKEAKNPDQQLFTIKNKISKKASIAALSKYIYVTYKAALEDPEMLQLFLSKLSDEALKNKEIWRGLKEATTHTGLQSDALLYVAKHAVFIEKEYGVKEIIQTINAAAKVSMRPYVMDQNIAGWEKLMAYLENELGRTGQTLNYAFNPSFYLNIKDYATAFRKMEEGIAVLKDRDPEVKAYLYRNWAWNVYHYYDEPEKITTGLDWINDAIQVHPTCINLETKAGLLFKRKDYQQAKLVANQAIQLEKKENVHAMLAHTILRELENIE